MANQRPSVNVCDSWDNKGADKLLVATFQDIILYNNGCVVHLKNKCEEANNWDWSCQPSVSTAQNFSNNNLPPVLLSARQTEKENSCSDVRSEPKHLPPTHCTETISSTDEEEEVHHCGDVASEVKDFPTPCIIDGTYEDKKVKSSLFSEPFAEGTGQGSSTMCTGHHQRKVKCSGCYTTVALVRGGTFSKISKMGDEASSESEVEDSSCEEDRNNGAPRKKKKRKKHKKRSYKQQLQHSQQSEHPTARMPYLPTMSSAPSGDSEQDADLQLQRNKNEHQLLNPGVSESVSIFDESMDHDRFSSLHSFGGDVLSVQSQSLFSEIGSKDRTSVSQTLTESSASDTHHAWIPCEASVHGDQPDSGTPCVHFESPPASFSPLMRPCVMEFPWYDQEDNNDSLVCCEEEEYGGPVSVVMVAVAGGVQPVPVDLFCTETATGMILSEE